MIDIVLYNNSYIAWLVNCGPSILLEGNVDGNSRILVVFNY